MEKQKGAALIVVLVLLAVSLMLGLSSVQSSLIDERLAGNYRAAAQAQMNAERAVSDMWSDIDEYELTPVPVSENDDSGLDDGFGWVELKKLASNSSGSCHILSEDAELSGTYDGVACYLGIYNGFKGKGNGNYIVAIGAVSNGSVAESEPVFVLVRQGDSFGPPSTTSFPGGIAAGADVQWPTSKKSRIQGGELKDEEGNTVEEVKSLSLCEEGCQKDGEGFLLTSQEIINEDEDEDKIGLVKGTVSGHDTPFLGLVDVVKGIYREYIEGGGDEVYPDIYFYENGMSYTGNHDLRGLHIVLNGEAQIGGNSSLSGALIVLNVDWENDDWTPLPATKAKFNGGGSEGTVWFDQESVEGSLRPFGITIYELFGIGDGDRKAGNYIDGWQ